MAEKLICPVSQEVCRFNNYCLDHRDLLDPKEIMRESDLDTHFHDLPEGAVDEMIARFCSEDRATYLMSLKDEPSTTIPGEVAINAVIKTIFMRRTTY